MKRYPDEPMLLSAQCRCCLQPVHSFWQPNFYDKGSKLFVHCKSSDCPLYYATREVHDWLTMDLSQWNATQHPRWTAPQDLLEVAEVA